MKLIAVLGHKHSPGTSWVEVWLRDDGEFENHIVPWKAHKFGFIQFDFWHILRES